jgi:hypothetical protein
LRNGSVLVDVLLLCCLTCCFLYSFFVHRALQMLLQLGFSYEGCLAELTALYGLRRQCCCCHDGSIGLLGCLEGLCALLAWLVVTIITPITLHCMDDASHEVLHDFQHQPCCL